MCILRSMSLFLTTLSPTSVRFAASGMRNEVGIASGYSSINNWETGSHELIKLYEIMTETEGIYGGRFSGAGFKGCCMALIDPAYEESIVEAVTRKYVKAFPSLEAKYSVHICESADGVHLN